MRSSFVCSGGRREIIALLSVGFFSAFSVASAQPPTFEVAVIKPAPAVRPQRLSSVRIDKNQMTISALSLSAVIAMAYHVHPAQVIGPTWLTTTAFTFTAKLPDGASVDQVPAMLRNLLIDRFKMTVRREPREQPVYALVQGKSGAKIKEKILPPEFTLSSEDQATTVQTPMGEMKRSSGGGRGSEIVGSGMKVSVNDDGTRLQMYKVSKLAEMLSTSTDRPVIDDTGLNGDYEIVVNIPADTGGSSGSGADIELFEAVEQQLGIKVNSSKALIDAIVIDSMEKTPSGN